MAAKTAEPNTAYFMFALEDTALGGFVTFGEFKGDYLVEDVTIDEAALFTLEESESVLDYFEDTVTDLKVRRVKISENS